MKCQCADPQCPVCSGQCEQKSAGSIYRVDMTDVKRILIETTGIVDIPATVIVAYRRDVIERLSKNGCQHEIRVVDVEWWLRDHAPELDENDGAWSVASDWRDRRIAHDEAGLARAGVRSEESMCVNCGADGAGPDELCSTCEIAAYEARL